jgi:hypothetical protein
MVGRANQGLVLELAEEIKAGLDTLTVDFAEVRGRLDRLVAGFEGLVEKTDNVGSRLARIEGRLHDGGT